MEITQLQNDEYTNVISEIYLDAPEYAVYKAILKDASGQEIALTGNSQAEFLIGTTSRLTAVFQRSELGAKEIKAVSTSNLVEFSANTMGTFVVTAGDAYNRWRHASYASDDTEIAYDWKFSGIFADGGYTGIAPRVEESDLGTVYYIGFKDFNGNALGQASSATTVSATLPYAGEEFLYIVIQQGTGDDATWFVKEVDLSEAVRADNTISFTLLGHETKDSNATKHLTTYIMYALGHGALDIDAAATHYATGASGYLLVTDQKIAGMPPPIRTLQAIWKS